MGHAQRPTLTVPPLTVRGLAGTGINVKQQVLCFAGNNLKDHLSLADHNLEAYTLSDEVGVGGQGSNAASSPRACPAPPWGGPCVL